jgi:hypothetical protein
MEIVNKNGSTSEDRFGALVEAAPAEVVKKALRHGNAECVFMFWTLERIRNAVK